MKNEFEAAALEMYSLVHAREAGLYCTVDGGDEKRVGCVSVVCCFFFYILYFMGYADTYGRRGEVRWMK